tara:strand:- start:142 stop:603 length:462 start_codon:yes stop_codon:yes gene_type:complete
LIKPTPEVHEAFNNILKARFRKEFKEFIGNLLSLISTLAAIILPFVLAIITGNWTNIFLILIYPCSLFSMAWIKHSTNQSFFKLFIPAFVLIVFMSISNAPYWFAFIGLGISASYHILFNELPMDEVRLQKALENPAYKDWITKQELEEKNKS